MDREILNIGDVVTDSNVGPGVVSGFYRGYPQVNGKAVGQLTRADGQKYGPTGRLRLPEDKRLPDVPVQAVGINSMTGESVPVAVQPSVSRPHGAVDPATVQTQPAPIPKDPAPFEPPAVAPPTWAPTPAEPAPPEEKAKEIAQAAVAAPTSEPGALPTTTPESPGHAAPTPAPAPSPTPAAPPATDAYVAVGSTRFSDSAVQTPASYESAQTDNAGSSGNDSTSSSSSD